MMQDPLVELRKFLTQSPASRYTLSNIKKSRDIKHPNPTNPIDLFLTYTLWYVLQPGSVVPVDTAEQNAVFTEISNELYDFWH